MEDRVQKLKELLAKVKAQCKKGKLDVFYCSGFQGEFNKFDNYYAVYKLASIYETYFEDVGYSQSKFDNEYSEEEKIILSEISNYLRKCFENLDYSRASNTELALSLTEDSYWTDEESPLEAARCCIDGVFGPELEERLRYGESFTNIKTTALDFFRILIERKELTEDVFLGLLPHIYPSNLVMKGLRTFLPIIPFSFFKNDYEWSKGDNEATIALKASLENLFESDYTYIIFDGIRKNDDDGDDNNGESPSPELVDA